MSSDRGNPRYPRAPGQHQGPRDDQAGQSRFAQRGISHEERMQDDDSARRFPGRSTGPGPRSTADGESYGSGGSYGYGGGFEHGGEGGYDERPTRDPSHSRDEFYESTGGFGHDVSGYGRHGLGYPGAGERRLGTRGSEGERRVPRAGHDDSRQGYSQDSGYAQSGGHRQEGGSQHQAGASGYGPSRAHSDGRGHEGGGPGTQRFSGQTAYGQPGRGRFYGRTPQGYTRSDERIREDVCDRLSHGHFDPSEVTVKVEQGVVTLEGFIASRSDKFHAEEVADAVMGVKDVDNRLRVKRDPPQQPAETSSSSSTEPSRLKNNPNGARS
ncbi:MAG: hypothetical protein RLZZ450_2896 [Pseudomonadota bacterium]|jgi:osmotically-inducible protein OsmY